MAVNGIIIIHVLPQGNKKKSKVRDQHTKLREKIMSPEDVGRSGGGKLKFGRNKLKFGKKFPIAQAMKRYF